MKIRCYLLVVGIMALSISASGQWIEKPSTGSPQRYFPDRTNVAGMVGLEPKLGAVLIDITQNAKQRKIVVQADVWGANLIAPENAEPRNDQAFLSFVLDDNPPAKTDQKEYTFRDVQPGQHTVTVRLLSADGQQVGSNVVLGVHIPK